MILKESGTDILAKETAPELEKRRQCYPWFMLSLSHYSTPWNSLFSGTSSETPEWALGKTNLSLLEDFHIKASDNTKIIRAAFQCCKQIRMRIKVGVHDLTRGKDNLQRTSTWISFPHEHNRKWWLTWKLITLSLLGSKVSALLLRGILQEDEELRVLKSFLLRDYILQLEKGGHVGVSCLGRYIQNKA